MMNDTSFLSTYLKLLPALAYGAWLRIRVQFARTLLGSSWIGISVLATMIVLGTIYGTITNVKNWPEYWIYVALGLTTWNTLSSSLNNSCTLLERARDRILNQRMPLGVFVIEEWVTLCIGFFIALAAVLVAMGWLVPSIWPNLLAGGWIGILNLLLGCLLLSLLISPAAAAVADLHQMMPILLQIGFLASPILFYRKSLGPLAWFTKFNPLYWWVCLARDPFLGEPHWGYQWLLLIIQIGLILASLRWLDRHKMSIIRWL